MEVLCLVMYLAMKMMLESTKLRTLDYVETFITTLANPLTKVKIISFYNVTVVPYLIIE